MLNSEKTICALREKKKYSNSCLVRKKNLSEAKYHKPPLQVKWSVPKDHQLKLHPTKSKPILNTSR